MGSVSFALLLMLVLFGSPAAQTRPAEAPQKPPEVKQAEQAKELLRELALSEYRAKMDIPAVDCLFVEDGKIVEGTYRSALKDNPKALPAGAVTKVSSVKVMGGAIQVFFATDSCAVIGVSSGSVNTTTMTIQELVGMAKKSIAPLFDTLRPEKAEEREKAERKAAPKKD